MKSNDIIIRATGAKVPIRFVMADLTETVNEIGRKHGAEAWALAQMGEACVAASFLASSLKYPGTVSFKAEYSGDLSFVQAEATPMGLTRAMIPQDELLKVGDFELMLSPLNLRVKKLNEHAKVLSEGVVEMATDKMGRNLAVYLLQSEQTKSAVGIEAMPDPNNPHRLLYAIGFMLEAFPDISEPELIIMEEVVRSLPPLPSFYNGEEYRIKDLLDQLAGPVEYQIHREISPEPHCPCSRDRSLSGVAALTEQDLSELIQKEESVSVTCDFCRTSYLITEDELKQILQEKKKG